MRHIPSLLAQVVLASGYLPLTACSAAMAMEPLSVRRRYSIGMTLGLPSHRSGHVGTAAQACLLAAGFDSTAKDSGLVIQVGMLYTC